MAKEPEWLIGTNPEIDAFIEAQPSSENAEIMRHIRQLLKQWLPELTERIAYKLPFFYLHGRLCYLKPDKEGVDWTFCHGMKLPGGKDWFVYDSSEQRGQEVGRIFIGNSTSDGYESPLTLLPEGGDDMSWEEVRALTFDAAEYNRSVMPHRRKATAAKRKMTQGR